MPQKVTVGVCGGIAAYKAAELVRALQERGLDPHVVMTGAATEFVRPLTFASLTGHKVITSLWPAEADADATSEASAIEHIAEAQTTELLLVAPATADILARFAHGLADDFLSTLYLATKAPVIAAPAMNVNMWQHPATQANLATLRGRGVEIVEPGSGYLACGMIGSGRLADIPAIVEAALARLHRRHDLAGETVLITAGGTREPIDPVRFLGNRSSGRMGYALAQAAIERGARVILVTAPTSLPPPPAADTVQVTRSSEMHSAVLARLPEATIVIAAAAVADFRPAAIAAEKIRRNGPLTLTFEPTEDIVRHVVERRPKGTLVIAFAAELESGTEDAIAGARAKLHRKGADAIVLNDISQPGIGFDADRNAAIWLTAEQAIDLPESSKLILAGRILDEARTLIHTQAPNRRQPAEAL